ERARQLAPANLSVLPPVAKELTRAFYNACDVCLVPLADAPVFQETVPSKIFEVMACARPVLASVAGEAADIVRASGGGRIAAPADPDAIASAVLEFVELTADERAAMGRRGRDYVTTHY